MHQVVINTVLHLRAGIGFSKEAGIVHFILGKQKWNVTIATKIAVRQLILKKGSAFCA